MEQTGARINVPPLSVMKDELAVSGEKDGVQIAATRIKSIWKDMVSANLLPYSPYLVTYYCSHPVVLVSLVLLVNAFVITHIWFAATDEFLIALSRGKCI